MIARSTGCGGDPQLSHKQFSCGGDKVSEVKGCVCRHPMFSMMIQCKHLQMQVIRLRVTAILSYV